MEEKTATSNRLSSVLLYVTENSCGTLTTSAAEVSLRSNLYKNDTKMRFCEVCVCLHKCVCVGRFVWVYKTMMYVIWTDGCFIILRWLTGTGNRWAQWPSFSSLSSTGKQITELIISEISWMVTVIKVFFNTSCQSCHMTVEGCVAGAVSQFLSNGCNMSPRNQTYCGDAR